MYFCVPKANVQSFLLIPFGVLLPVAYLKGVNGNTWTTLNEQEPRGLDTLLGHLLDKKYRYGINLLP